MKRLKTLLIILSISIASNSQIRSGISPFRFVPDMYFGANIGPNVFFGEGVGQYLLNGSIGFSESVFVGYNFSELIGSRIIGSFGNMNWPLLIPNNKNTQFSTMSMSIEGLLNVSNIFNYYNLKQPFEFVLFGGVGLISREKALYNNEYIGALLKAGGQIDYRLNYNFEINAKFTGNILNDKFNENATGLFFDAFPEFNLGVTYHLRGNRKFR